MRKNKMQLWLIENRDMCIEMLRVYLGIGLIIKGFQFLLNEQLATEYMNRISLPFFEFLSLHVVVVVHLAAGFLLAIGLITRIAALIQIPLLLGAIFFVHMQQGLFSRGENLEFTLLVLFLLLVFSVYGGGRLSVDYLIEQRRRIRHEDF